MNDKNHCWRREGTQSAPMTQGKRLGKVRSWRPITEASG